MPQKEVKIDTLQLSLLDKQHAIIKHKIEQQEENERIIQQQLQQEALKQKAQEKENRRSLIKDIASNILIITLLIALAVLLIMTANLINIILAAVAIMFMLIAVYELQKRLFLVFKKPESSSALKAQETQTSALTPTASNTLSSMLGGSAPHAEIPPPMPPQQNAAGAIIVKPLETNEQSDMPAEDFGFAKSTAP